ncbi:DDE-type integrase/transposase/recombinase [Paraburkholderia adhaesiva]|uniref:DDE-type integrase/transposase/recombinase n=1 Tax=Paraburkholderia adhaesiva TaxID=2883244 RepID=UPI001F33ACDF|nr:DDE-type integrase/transposase/recombinase [Paraburkholderia adhaesiva]
MEALYRKPNASPRNAQREIWRVPVARHEDRLDQSGLGARHNLHSDGEGVVHVTAVVDWSSRKVLAHRVAIAPEAVYAVEALEEAFARYGLPAIVNTDQRSHFTTGAFTGAVPGPRRKYPKPVRTREARFSAPGQACFLAREHCYTSTFRQATGYLMVVRGVRSRSARFSFAYPRNLGGRTRNGSQALPLLASGKIGNGISGDRVRVGADSLR